MLRWIDPDRCWWRNQLSLDWKGQDRNGWERIWGYWGGHIHLPWQNDSDMQQGSAGRSCRPGCWAWFEKGHRRRRWLVFHWGTLSSSWEGFSRRAFVVPFRRPKGKCGHGCWSSLRPRCQQWWTETQQLCERWRCPWRLLRWRKSKDRGKRFWVMKRVFLRSGRWPLQTVIGDWWWTTWWCVVWCCECVVPRGEGPGRSHHDEELLEGRCVVPNGQSPVWVGISNPSWKGRPCWVEIPPRWHWVLVEASWSRGSRRVPSEDRKDWVTPVDIVSTICNNRLVRFHLTNQRWPVCGCTTGLRLQGASRRPIWRMVDDMELGTPAFWCATGAWTSWVDFEGHWGAKEHEEAMLLERVFLSTNGWLSRLLGGTEFGMVLGCCWQGDEGHNRLAVLLPRIEAFESI